jgi:hypothetical protein
MISDGTDSLLPKLSTVLPSKSVSPFIVIVKTSSPMTLIGCSLNTLVNNGNSINVLRLFFGNPKKSSVLMMFKYSLFLFVVCSRYT